MRTFSEKPCPNCKEYAVNNINTEPFNYTVITCFNCGLTVTPKISYLSLDELNAYRADADLEHLETLPEQNKF